MTNLLRHELAAVISHYTDTQDVRIAGVAVPFATFDNRTGKVATGTTEVRTLWAQQDSNHWNEDAPHIVAVALNAVYAPDELYVDGDFVLRRKSDNARADLVDEASVPAEIKPFEPLT